MRHAYDGQYFCLPSRQNGFNSHMALSVAANVSSRFYSSYPDRDIRRTVRPLYRANRSHNPVSSSQGNRTACFLLGTLGIRKRLTIFRDNQIVARKRLSTARISSVMLSRKATRNIACTSRNCEPMRAVPAIQNVLANGLVRVAGIFYLTFS